MKDKLNIGVFRYDADSELLRDMFQDELPKHPRVASVDWQWTTTRFGKEVCKPKSVGFIEENLANYDLVFADLYNINEKRKALFDKHNVWKKLVVFDTYDNQHFTNLELLDKCLLYIKRSWWESLTPKDRDNILVLDFGIIQSYLDVIPQDYYKTRNFAVTCTLQQAKRGAARDRIVKAVKDTDWPLDAKHNHSQVTLIYAAYAKSGKGYRYDLAPPAPEVNWWYIYMHMLRRTKILFTGATPQATNDFRTYESFSSGALVFIDEIRTPQPNPLIAGKHYIKFDLNDIPKTMELAKTLLVKDVTERENIAKAGYEHAVTYHSAKARVDYAMQEILKRLEKNE